MPSRCVVRLSFSQRAYSVEFIVYGRKLRAGLFAISDTTDMRSYSQRDTLHDSRLLREKSADLFSMLELENLHHQL